MKTLEEYKKIVEPFKQKLVLDGLGVVKLIGVMETEKGFCWILESNDVGVYEQPVSTKWIPLQGSIKDEYYKMLEDFWNKHY